MPRTGHRNQSFRIDDILDALQRCRESVVLYGRPSDHLTFETFAQRWLEIASAQHDSNLADFGQLLRVEERCR
jgi:hypothetical protein